MAKWNRLLVLSPLLLLVIIPVYAPSGNKWTTNCRFHLSTQDTYIYLGEAVYADYTYLHDDKLNFTNAYMRPGDTISNFSIAISHADVTINHLMIDGELSLRIGDPTSNNSTLTISSFTEYPQVLLVNEQPQDYAWSATNQEVSVTIHHTDAVDLRLLWSGWAPPDEPSPGPSPPPPVTPPVTPPPVTPPLPVTPPVEAPSTHLMLLGGAVITVIIVASAVAKKKPSLSRSRSAWRASQRQAAKTKPKFPKSKPLTAPKKKKAKPKKVKKRKVKKPRWEKDKAWQ